MTLKAWNPDGVHGPCSGWRLLSRSCPRLVSRTSAGAWVSAGPASSARWSLAQSTPGAPPGRSGGCICGAPLLGTHRPSSGLSCSEAGHLFSRIESSPGTETSLGQRPPSRVEQSFQPQDSQTWPESSRAMFYWGESEWSSCDQSPVSVLYPWVGLSG